MKEKIKRPSLFHFFTEGFRMIWELIQSAQFRRKYTPRQMGNGHPVLVIPGLFGNDMIMIPMRKFLRRLGYTPYKWGLGINTAKPEDIDALLEKVDILHQKHQEKISIIGWSLGGIYAREVAKRKPDKVRQVITTGSPFGGIENPNNVAWVLRLLKGKVENFWDKALLDSVCEPTPVLTTSIYSKTDGMVRWQDCMSKAEDGLHRNVEAGSSHLGMPYNISILKVIAERLPDSAPVVTHAPSKLEI